MRIVSRYLLREFLLASSAVLLGLVVTVLAADTLLHIEDVDDGLMELLLDAVERMLGGIPLAVPMACAIGVVWSVTRAMRARELTAIRCGGIALRGALLPIVAASLLIAVGLGYFEDRVIMKTRQARIGGEQAGEQPQPVKRQGHWWYSSGPAVFVAKGYDSRNGMLSDLTYFEYGPTRALVRRIDAASAVHIEGHTWEFREAVVRDFAAERLQVRGERTLHLDLGLSGAAFEAAERPIEVETLQGLAKRMREEAGPELVLLEARLHSRLAQPLAVLVLVLLAISFAAGDAERGDSFPRALLAAIVAAAVFWMAWSLALLGARSSVVPPALPIWAVMLAFLAFASWRFRALSE